MEGRFSITVPRIFVLYCRLTEGIVVVMDGSGSIGSCDFNKGRIYRVLTPSMLQLPSLTLLRQLQVFAIKLGTRAKTLS